MYISIDVENLALLHKHDDPNVVCDLVELEAPEANICIMPIDLPGITYPLTEMELGVLYRNTTGTDSPVQGYQELTSVMDDLCNRMRVTDVDRFELDRQIVNRKGRMPLKYVKGSYLPSKAPPSLYSPKVKPPQDLAAVLACKPVGAPPATTPKATPTKAPQQPPAAPRKGVKGLIWEVADQLWERDGKPVERAQVLALRKRVMDVLETDHSVKRNTSSNELGNWQKNRVAGGGKSSG